MIRSAMWTLLGVVGVSAAVLSFSALTALAAMCGFSPKLAPLLPIVIDAGAAAGCLAWLGPPTPGTRFARSLTFVLLASSVAGNAVEHGLTAYHLAPPWWGVVTVSAVAPAVLGAVIHLAVLTVRGTHNPSTQGEAHLPHPGRQAVTRATTESDKLEVDRPQACESDELLTRAREVLAVNPTVGRGVLARELDITEHQARQLLAATNGQR